MPSADSVSANKATVLEKIWLLDNDSKEVVDFLEDMQESIGNFVEKVTGLFKFKHFLDGLSTEQKYQMILDDQAFPRFCEQIF